MVSAGGGAQRGGQETRAGEGPVSRPWRPAEGSRFLWVCSWTSCLAAADTGASVWLSCRL